MGFTVSTSDRDSLINCNFSNNGIAISSRFVYMAGNILTDNDTAYISFAFGTDLIFNNYFFHNQVGMLYGGGTFASFSNNYICNNSNYNIIYTSSGNGSIPPVCFCDTDSATIRSTIYDGYVDISRGLLNFSPFVNCDSSAITALPPIDCQTVISTQVDELSNHSGSEELVIYPNPVSDYLTVHFKNNVAPSQIWIINLLGEVKYGSSATGAETNLNISSLAGGIYFVEVAQGNKVSRERFVKQ
jgi:hypothetical protein